MEREISERYPVYFDFKYFPQGNISSFCYFILIEHWFTYNVEIYPFPSSDAMNQAFNKWGFWARIRYSRNGKEIIPEGEGGANPLACNNIRLRESWLPRYAMFLSYKHLPETSEGARRIFRALSLRLSIFYDQVEFPDKKGDEVTTIMANGLFRSLSYVIILTDNTIQELHTIDGHTIDNFLFEIVLAVAVKITGIFPPFRIIPLFLMSLTKIEVKNVIDSYNLPIPRRTIDEVKKCEDKAFIKIQAFPLELQNITVKELIINYLYNQNGYSNITEFIQKFPGLQVK